MIIDSRNNFAESNSVRGYSSDAGIVETEFNEILEHYYNPYSRQPLRQKFCNLAVTWMLETSVSSSITHICMHPAYQEIIGMGSVVMPWILIALQHEPNHWFWALKALSGVDPVPSEYKGDTQKMTEYWLKWGVDNGYI